MMFKNLLMFLVLGMLVAMPATAMAADYLGYGGDFLGPTTQWDDPNNWEGGENEWGTGKWSVDPGDSGGVLPLISASADTFGGSIRVRSAGVVTQEGGTVDFVAGGFPNPGNTLAIYDNDSAWNISGGNLMVAGVAAIGYQPYGESADGTASLNISGDGVVTIYSQDWIDADLLMNTSTELTIAGQGALIIDSVAQSSIDALIASGNIVGIGGALVTATVGDTYVVTVPEPGTLLLLCLGLGSLALIRRR